MALGREAIRQRHTVLFATAQAVMGVAGQGQRRGGAVLKSLDIQRGSLPQACCQPGRKQYLFALGVVDGVGIPPNPAAARQVRFLRTPHRVPLLLQERVLYAQARKRATTQSTKSPSLSKLGIVNQQLAASKGASWPTGCCRRARLGG